MMRICNFLGINYHYKDLSVPNPSSKFHIRDYETWKSDNLKFGVKIIACYINGPFSLFF